MTSFKNTYQSKYLFYLIFISQDYVMLIWE